MCDNWDEKSKSKIQFEITRLPEILTIHLKRFDYVKGRLLKLENLINYPLKNLSLADYVDNKKSESKNTYDLYGVCNHIQLNVAGGHYKSYIQYDPIEEKKTNPKIGENWYEWNDDRISSVTQDQVIDKNAFLLFYKRQEFNASNIVDLLSFVDN